MGIAFFRCNKIKFQRCVNTFSLFEFQFFKHFSLVKQKNEMNILRCLTKNNMPFEGWAKIFVLELVVWLGCLVF